MFKIWSNCQKYIKSATLHCESQVTVIFVLCVWKKQLFSSWWKNNTKTSDTWSDVSPCHLWPLGPAHLSAASCPLVWILAWLRLPDPQVLCSTPMIQQFQHSKCGFSPGVAALWKPCPHELTVISLGVSSQQRLPSVSACLLLPSVHQILTGHCCRLNSDPQIGGSPDPSTSECDLIWK